MTVQRIGKILTIVGLILIYGALGAADVEDISIARFCVALAFRIPLTLAGICMSGYGN